MKITVSHVGYLHLQGIDNNSSIEIDEGTTVEKLLEDWGMTHEHMRYVVPVVNDIKRDLTHVLRENDSLFLYLPAGGG